MRRSKRSGQIIHEPRDVSTCRPMHLTVHCVDGLPSLRTETVLQAFRRLVAEARERGVRTVAFVLLENHLHWMVIPESREALRDATRYVFSRLAGLLNRLLGRSRGKVFRERYHSVVGRVVRHAFQMLAYLLKNPAAAGFRTTAPRQLDPFARVDVPFLARHPFLRTVFGPEGAALDALLLAMSRGPVRFEPLRERLQPRLPGFL